MMPQITLNIELFIKLMKMTTSSTDGEALAALRAANRALSAGGGDWENLLRGKLAPVDPFVSLARPTTRESAPQAPPPRPTPPPPPPPPKRVRGLDKKEAKQVTGWLATLEFARLNYPTQRQYNVVAAEWKTHKALTNTDWDWLRNAASRTKP